jgi:prolyl oligopeptidase PreP (S9A serine peptidase family)
MTSAEDSNVLDEDDPYIFLEEVESEESIAFAKMANKKCLARLGDPSHTDTYKRVLAALESDDRQATLWHLFSHDLCSVAKQTNKLILVSPLNHVVITGFPT